MSAIKFAKIRDVHDPVRGTSKSAGIDLYCPTFTEDFIRVFNARNTNAQSMAMFNTVQNNILIRPHGQVWIPSGLTVNFLDLENSALIAFNKSGFSWDSRLSLLACVVDQDYQSELMLTMVNYSDYPTAIIQGQKLTQVVRVPVYYDTIEMVSQDQIHTTVTERGGGAMGSTGK